MRSGSVVLAVVLLLVVAVPASAAGGNENTGPAPAPRALDRASLTGEIVGTWRAEARARGLELEAWEADMEKALSTKNDGQLLAIKSAKSLDDARLLLGASSAPPEPNALGDDASDLVYFPLTPCRILDTRLGTGNWAGPLAAGSTTAVAHNQNLIAQGGNGAGCGVPTDPAAIAATVTVANATGAGDLRVYATGTTEPNASVINYAAVAGLNLANTSIIPTGQILGNDFYVKVDVSATHVIVDVVGYFWRPTFGAKVGFVWAAAHVTGGASPTVTRSFNLTGGGTPTVTRVVAGEYRVGFGVDVSARHYAVSLGNSATGVPSAGNCSATPSASSANEVYVDCYNLSGTGTDNNFYLQVF